jgi:hypothetical protein
MGRFCGAKLVIFDKMSKKSTKKAVILRPQKQKKWKSTVKK